MKVRGEPGCSGSLFTLVAPRVFDQAGFVGEVEELVVGDVFELLAALFELFVEFNGAFGHVLMSFFGAAGEEEVFAGSDPGVAIIVVETEAEEERFLFSFFGHKGS